MEFNIEKAINFLGNTNVSYQYTKKELREHFEWFVENIELHLKMFSERINAYSDDIHWTNEFTPESLIRLVEILYEYIDGQRISEEEYLKRVDNSPIIIKKSVMRYELTHDELILSFLMSVYIGEVVIRSNPSADLKWGLCKLPKNYMYSGHVVIPISEFSDCVPSINSNWAMYTVLRYKYEGEPKKVDCLYDYYKRVTSSLHNKD